MLYEQKKNYGVAFRRALLVTLFYLFNQQCFIMKIKGTAVLMEHNCQLRFEVSSLP